MQASPPITEAFAPLPLRARGVLELLDVAIKLYKRYFWVLLGWSALTILASIIPGVSYVAWMMTPLVIGATGCCIAAAVRGQQVTFSQCWNFTRPRYGAMLGMYVLGICIVFLVALVLMMAGGLVFGAGILIFNQAPSTMQIIAAIIGWLLFMVVATLGGTAAMVWQSMVPIVVCMEDNKRNTQALARAYDLLRGNWVRISTLMAVLVLGALALTAILFVTGTLIVGLPTIRDVIMNERPPDSRLIAVFGSLALLWVIMWVLWNPMFYVTMVLFYLDIRIRKEALDLEWTAHTTAPASAPGVLDAQMPPGAEVGAPPTGVSSPTPLVTSTAPPSTAPPSSAPATTATVQLPVDPQPMDQQPMDQPAVETPFSTPILPSTEQTPANEIRCPHCGASSPADQTFCTRCGALLTLQ